MKTPLLALLLLAAAPALAQDATHVCEKKLDTCSQDLTETNETLKTERARVNALSKKALSIEGELEKALAEIERLKSVVADLEGKLKAANERIAALEKELADLKVRYAALEKEDLSHHVKIAELEARIAALEKELAEAKARITVLEKENADDKARIAALEKQNADSNATIAATKDALAELQKRKAEADARIAEFKGLIAKFQKLIDSGKLRVKIVDGRMVVEVATDILFASGSAELSKEGKAAVKEVGQILASIADRKFQIEGHTDNVPMNSEKYPSNWELAAGRAINVVKTMLDAGMPKERVSAASFADARPAASNDSSLGKKANRRIEIVVVPDLSSLPGFDELNKVSGTGG